MFRQVLHGAAARSAGTGRSWWRFYKHNALVRALHASPCSCSAATLALPLAASWRLGACSVSVAKRGMHRCFLLTQTPRWSNKPLMNVRTQSTDTVNGVALLETEQQAEHERVNEGDHDDDAAEKSADVHEQSQNATKSEDFLAAKKAHDFLLESTLEREKHHPATAGLTGSKRKRELYRVCMRDMKRLRKEVLIEASRILDLRLSKNVNKAEVLERVYNCLLQHELIPQKRKTSDRRTKTQPDVIDASQISAATKFKRIVGVDELARALVDAHAVEVASVDVSRECSWTDAFIFATAKSHEHLQMLARAALQKARERTSKVSERHNVAVASKDNWWQTVDAGNCVVHVVLDEKRHRLDLIQLWADAHASNIAFWTRIARERYSRDGEECASE